MNAALIWAGRGLAVFPCRGEDKAPFTTNGYLAATTDPEQIRCWWTRWPDALIGIPTGRASGFTVIDVDAKDGKPGLDWLEQHSAALPITRTHRTRSGGVHLIFRAPDREVRNSA